MVRLAPEHSERLAVLFERYETWVLNYARRKLLNRGLASAEASLLAEDIAQEAWVCVARTGAKDLLLPGLDTNDEILPILFTRVKQVISGHFRSPMAAEESVDWADPETCAGLCPLLPEGCALAALPVHLAKMVARLPERERRALMMKLDGVPVERIAEHLECDHAAVRRALSVALVLLQVGNPGLPCQDAAEVALEGWERDRLATVGANQREALLRLADTPRRVLLLVLTGATAADAAAQLGMSVRFVRNLARALAALQALDGGAAHVAAEPRKHQSIAAVLRSELAGLRPGDRLPSNRGLMTRFGCASRTVTKSLQILRDQGLIEANGAYGYTVARAQHDMEQAA